MARHHVFLVPGFFGFVSLGDLTYFGHVAEWLQETLRQLGVEADVQVIHTSPTASLRRRAALLAERVAAAICDDEDPVHLVGHSSGGLDVRLLVTPDVSLPTDVDVEAVARRVRSVVTVATPHHGTPVATFFTSFLGQQLLRVLSLMTIHTLRSGRIPIKIVLKLVGLLVRPGQAPGPATSTLEQMYFQLLGDFSTERRRALEVFFRDVGGDQDLVPQLAPAAMDVFNASTQDRPGVRYGAVVTRGRPPGLRSALAAGFDPYAQATHALYVALQRLASGTSPDRVAPVSSAQGDVLRHAYGKLPDHRANDGIVPTRSQVWGDVIHAAWADHLDVVGHFDHTTHVPPHFDWISSGSSFTRRDFERLWRDVAWYAVSAQ